MERSNTEGTQFKGLHEETRSVNASIAPEVVRIQAREAQLVTDVTSLQKQETELQGQLQNLHPENARVYAPLNQILITINSVQGTRTSRDQLQTSEVEIGRLQAEACDLRNWVERVKQIISRKNILQ